MGDQVASVWRNFNAVCISRGIELKVFPEGMPDPKVSVVLGRQPVMADFILYAEFILDELALYPA